MDSSELARWYADVAARQTRAELEATGLLCDRCGRHTDGISRYPEGWLCDPCVAIVDAPEEDEDDVFVGWDASAELFDEMRRDSW